MGALRQEIWHPVSTPVFYVGAGTGVPRSRLRACPDGESSAWWPGLVSDYVGVLKDDRAVRW